MSRKQFSLRSLVVCITIIGAGLGGYLKLSSDSRRQFATITEFESQGGGFWRSQETPFRIGHCFGFVYPIDSISVVKGSERADWGVVPGWECTDSDVGILKHFRNVEDVYFRNSKFVDASIRQLLYLPKLKNLEFYNCDLSECTMSVFAEFPTLLRIKFRGSNCKRGSVDDLRMLAPHIELSGAGG